MRTSFINRVLGKQAKLDREVLLDCLLEVAEERDLLNLIFDTMTEGVLVFDESEILHFTNRRACDLLSLDPRGSMRKPLSGLTLDAEMADPIRQCLRTGEPVRGLEVLILRPQPAAIRVEIVPLADHHGRFGGVLVFLLEVTEEKRREVGLREGKRLSALATLSASLAHDIRNPLNSMSIHLQLLERQLRKDGQDGLLKTTGIIQDEIRNLNEKLTRFLDAARPRRPQFEEISVHALIEETLELMRPELEQAGVTTEYYAPSVHTTVFADRVDLRKAFLNIVKNSIEAMPEGGRLVVRIRNEPSEVSILFEDTGSGISPEALEHVMELGFTTKDTGSGLGLPQVDRCVREHFGTLNIDSAPGRGTRIHIGLPIHSQGQRLIGMNPPPASLPEIE